MSFDANAVTIIVFSALFLLVTVLGFVAARWKRGDLDLLDEWGLGGRRFGTVITWFLLGGDLFTAYTFIAIPALVFAVGAGVDLPGRPDGPVRLHGDSGRPQRDGPEHDGSGPLHRHVPQLVRGRRLRVDRHRRAGARGGDVHCCWQTVIAHMVVGI